MKHTIAVEQLAGKFQILLASSSLGTTRLLAVFVIEVGGWNYTEFEVQRGNEKWRERALSAAVRRYNSL